MATFVKDLGDGVQDELGAEPGSALFNVLANDPEWTQTGKDAPEQGESDPNADLGSMKRDELNAVAAELGVENAEALSTKDDVTAAIIEARAAAE